MRGFVVCLVASTCVLLAGDISFAQTYGIEFHNTVMPASGGMAGTSFSQPQDVQSAIGGNPATMVQFPGTQFSFGGAYAEATYNVTQATPLPLLGVTPYSGKSDTPGGLVGNIGVIHQVDMLGRPVTMGMGFLTNAAVGVDFRPFPESNGTHASYLSLDVVSSVATRVTQNLSIGASAAIATSVLDGPFVDTSSSQTDNALRGTVGANYDMGGGFTVGGFWQSKKNQNFENVVRFGNGAFQSLRLDHPSNVGFGVANRCLMNGRLLLAADAIFKQYSEADFFRAIYRDQWVFQLGGQYAMNQRMKLRFGYAYNEDPTLDTVPGTIGGVIPVGGIPAVRYVQGQFAAVSQHRLTGGVGIQDLMPGVDFDLSLGGMFEADKSFGSTTASVESYWIAFGFTWRCGAPITSCCQPCAVPVVASE